MNAEIILTHLRRFYLGFSAVIFAGSLLELTVINHTQEPLQWTPFLLCVFGSILIAWAAFRPERRSLLALRAGMLVIMFGSLVGVMVHVIGNLEFALEINPNLSFIQRVMEALGGANPLMAPGVLAMAALMALSATYQHPVLVSSENAKISPVLRKVQH